MNGNPTSSAIAPFIADTLKAYRWRAQLTVKQLARRAGIEVNYLISVENAKRKIGLEALVNVGYALGVKPSELVKDVMSRIDRNSKGSVLSSQAELDNKLSVYR